MYIDNTKVLGNNGFIFYGLIGGRGTGKTFSTQKYCLKRFFKRGERFLWLRLTEASTRKLLANNGMDFIDSKLIERFNISSMETKSNVVYINGKEACRVMALSTFYNDKGVALNKSAKERNEKAMKDFTKMAKKYRIIVLDEMNREKSEKKSFDIAYAFVNQLENICRLDTDRRIFLLGNSLDEASDILANCFNFIPNRFGLFKLHKKKAIIYYYPNDREYDKARSESIAGLLTPNESTFTNVVVSDADLIVGKGKAKAQLRVIRFSNSNYFVWHEGMIITKMKVPQETKMETIAMVPYIPRYPFYKDRQTMVIEMAQQRMFKFDQLLTMKLFLKEIKLLKQY